jgi:hypothetical protein
LVADSVVFVRPHATKCGEQSYAAQEERERNMSVENFTERRKRCEC